jgi:pyridoxamine 5'-phosphate oxidase
MDLSNQRQEYEQDSVDIDSLESCPIRQFDLWFKAANSSEMLEPNAMILSTVDAEHGPTQRTVLLKYFDESGFVFFTNYSSRKALQIAANKNVSLLFPWYALQRQVEVNGLAEKISAGESIKYFASRPRGSQLGAWVSNQSSIVSTRSILHNKLAEIKAKFGSGSIPMPSFWGGFRIKPRRIEFWQGGVNRLHDRIQYEMQADAGNWQRTRLSP